MELRISWTGMYDGCAGDYWLVDEVDYDNLSHRRICVARYYYEACFAACWRDALDNLEYAVAHWLPQIDIEYRKYVRYIRMHFSALPDLREDLEPIDRLIFHVDAITAFRKVLLSALAVDDPFKVPSPPTLA